MAAFNCDNLLLSGTLKVAPDPAEEIVKARLECNLSWNQIATILINGVKASFDQTIHHNDSAFIKQFQQDVDTVIAQAMLEDPDIDQ